MSHLSLALEQINSRLGDLPGNLEKHLALAAQARDSGADLILSHALSLTGYALQALGLAQLVRTRARVPVLRDERTALTLRERLRIHAANPGQPSLPGVGSRKAGGHD
ncbi:MAG: hypothetical protein MUO23_02965 [Anaerolineales bacterium]|nr:hypothetical protein [Anaerolineales bacterium]